MESIDKKVVELIQEKYVIDIKTDKFIKNIEYINKMCLGRKSSYDIPLRDTIGRTYYNKLNRSMI